MQIPRIHDNGTPKLKLLLLLDAATECLDVAYRAIKQTSPNPRDYEEIEKATEEHMGRLRAVDAVKEQLNSIISGIESQPNNAK